MLSGGTITGTQEIRSCTFRIFALALLNRSLNDSCAHIKSFSSPFAAFLCPPRYSLSYSLPESPLLPLSSLHVLPLHGGQKCSGTAVFPPRMLLPLARSGRGESTRQLSLPRASQHLERCTARASPPAAALPFPPRLY